MRVVGVTGLPGAGKGALIELLKIALQERGTQFQYLSMSDILRNLALERFGEFDRDTLNQLGNELRLELGNGALAVKLLPEVEAILSNASDVDGVLVIDSIRTPEEVLTLKDALGADFLLVAVVAPEQTIAARIRSRSRNDESPGAVQDTQGALDLLERERGKGQPAHGLNVSVAISLADLTVDNSAGLETLRLAANAIAGGSIDRRSNT